MYEIIPAAKRDEDARTEQHKLSPTEAVESRELLLTLNLHYKLPTGDVSIVNSYPVSDSDADFADASVDFKFTSAVASFGMVLRGSKHQGETTFTSIISWAKHGSGLNIFGRSASFNRLVRRAEAVYVGAEEWMRKMN